MKTKTSHWADSAFAAGLGIGIASAGIGLAVFLMITGLGIAIHLEKNAGPLVVIEHREASK